MKKLFLLFMSLSLAYSYAGADTSAKPINNKVSDSKVIEIYEVKTKDDDKNPYIQMPITYDLYSFSHKNDLSDLVAMDDKKNILPLRLVSIAASSETSDEEMARSNLSFIPVPADLSADALREMQSTQVKVSKEKNKVTTKVETQTQILGQQTPEFYLIDLKALEQDSNQLEIQWEPAAQAEYVEVEIEATRNLEDWESLGKKMLVQARSISADKNENQFLDNKIALNLAQNEYDYLRIKIIRGEQFFKLTRVTGLQIKKQIHRLMPKEESWAVEGLEAVQQNAFSQQNQSNQSAKNNEAPQAVAAWEYKRDEATPTESLSLDIGDFSYADSISIYSRASEKQMWQLVYQGPWIHVQVGDQWQTGSAISLYKNQHKFWRLEMSQALRGSAAPKLNFSWHPYHLQIIASNRPPFHLAIDMQASAIKSKEEIFQQLIEKANPVWSQAELVSLNIDPEYTQQSVVVQSPWRQWLFWLCLIAAVVVLFIFSWKLIQELKQNPISSDE